jgi:hypothetical protein
MAVPLWVLAQGTYWLVFDLIADKPGVDRIGQHKPVFRY